MSNYNEELINAAEDGDFETVKMYIEKGADVKVKTEYEGTLLHLAAAVNYSDIFDIPEIQNIDIESFDKQTKQLEAQIKQLAEVKETIIEWFPS